MSEEKKINDQQESGSPEQLSLNDDRRVKVLSPGTLVAKRFFRNRLAVVGLTILAVMFIFSFIGGLISPYGQDEVFYRDDIQLKEYAAMSENTEYRYLVARSSARSSRRSSRCTWARTTAFPTRASPTT